MVHETVKLAHVFPERVDSLADAKTFMVDFLEGRNRHHHTGIGLTTTADIDHGLVTAKAVQRVDVLAAARARQQHRHRVCRLSPTAP